MVDDRTALMSARALAPGYEILWYTIDKVLGQGGFGITYLAHDRNLDRAVAIKEYLPTTFAYRHQDYSVKPITGDHRENFVWGLGSFLKEAQTLARFSHPNIVRVHSVFEENNTAYMVMEYEVGQNLATIYKNQNNFEQRFFEQIFFPIFDGLKEIHKFDFIHRDIKPANIYIREDGTPVLIDFGSARQTTQQQTAEITTLVSQGYTPLEQYSANYGDQGPWTDIYALAATIYEGIVGKKPEESLSRSACLMRSKPDLLERLDANRYPRFEQVFLDAIYAGLKLEPEGRPQSLEAWSKIFAGEIRISTEPPRELGFTEIEDEDDRTRIQPRRPAPKPAGSVADFPSADDILSFDDDDFDTDARERTEHGAARKRPAKPNRKKKGSGVIVAGILVISLIGAGGAYYWYVNSNTAQPITVAMLSKMPQPPRPVETFLPEERVVEQLDSMAKLAPLLNQAFQLNSTEPSLIASVKASQETLLELAKSWNATRHQLIANKIIQVSKELPAEVHQHSRIVGILMASEQVSANDQVLALLEDGQYLKPAGNSVLDKISTLSAGDFEKIKSTSQWNKMMAGFKKAATDKLTQSDFQGAAQLTEVALTMDSQDPEFTALRNFLSRR